MNHVRRLGVYVDESEPDTFHWVLHEYLARLSIWSDVLESERAYSTWLEAWEDGCLEVLRQVEDMRVGPREPQGGAGDGQGAKPSD